MIKSIAIAISFLTCLPINPGKVEASDMRRAIGFLPLSGLVIGGITAAFIWGGMMLYLPFSILAVLATLLLAYLTRGLHLDGVADLADGFGGSLDSARRLEIMKDSATGSFGVVALIGLLGLKTVCLYQLFDFGLMSLVIVVMASVSARFWMLVMAFGAVYPRDTGTGHFIIGQVRGIHILLAVLFLCPIYFAPLPCLAVLCLGALPPFILRLRANKLIGGVTGDVLGASVEWGETFGLLGGLLYLGTVYV
jgi:adenosylcobinamide-GDP ribazoletransferase